MALRQTLSAAPALASRRHAFPGEDEAYTKARKSLLAEEIDLRRKMTRLAEQRRARWQRLAQKLGVPLLALSTAQDLIEQLRDHLSGPQAGKRA